MRVLLTSHGSTGDIYPIIALSVALQKAGHDVRFATVPHYRTEIETAGIEFCPLCPDAEPANLSYWVGRLQKIRTPLYQLREIYVGAKSYLPEMIRRMDAAVQSADLFVSSYLFPMNKGIADRHHVPFATYAFAHNVVPSPDYPPSGFISTTWLPRRVRHPFNRWLWRVGDRVIDHVINTTIQEPLNAAGLPRIRRFFTEPAERVIVGVSEKLMRPPDAEIDPRFRFTGYCRWQAPVDPRLELELTAFCQGEKVPVITFGSMVYDDPGSIMGRLVRAWPLDRKLIVQRGWAQFPALADQPHIKVIEKVSHDQLFRHAAAVVHHGGAGTTASALHSGKPQLVVPHIADQFFFGREVERLGCGFRISKTRWPEQLPAAIDRLLTTSSYNQNAARVQRILSEENGPERAVGELEKFVAEARGRT